MFAIPGATSILAAIILAAGSFALGGYLGYDLAQGHEARRIKDSQDVAIAEARENVVRDTASAKARARRVQTAALAARAARSEGVADANLKARPDYAWDSDSLRMLNAAIDAANGSASPADGMPDRLPDDAKTGFRFGRIDSHLDLRSD